jgi:hypothetical protein
LRRHSFAHSFRLLAAASPIRMALTERRSVSKRIANESHAVLRCAIELERALTLTFRSLLLPFASVLLAMSVNGKMTRNISKEFTVTPMAIAMQVRTTISR